MQQSGWQLFSGAQIAVWLSWKWSATPLHPVGTAASVNFRFQAAWPRVVRFFLGCWVHFGGCFDEFAAVQADTEA